MMPTYNSVELGLIGSNPADPVDYGAFGGKVRIQLATINYASQQIGDTINLFRIPKGGRVVAMFASATLSSSPANVEIGDVFLGNKYRAAAVISATQTQIAFVGANVIALPGAVTPEGYNLPYAQETTIFGKLTLGAMPASGTAVITCLYTVN